MAITAGIIGGLSLVNQVVQGNKQQRAQREQLRLQQQANDDAKQRAKEAADRNDIEINRANRRSADVSAIQSKEEQSAMAGAAGTLLTGSQGVTNDQYNLGGNTLLGG